MLRRCSAILLAALVVAMVTALALPPKPKVTRVSAAFVIAPDSTVNATALVAVNGQLQPGDSIRYKFTKDSVVVLNKLGMPPSLLANLPAPGYGQTSSYNACARVVYANGTQSAEKCATTPWIYTRPALPPPPATIESIEIRPASFTTDPDATGGCAAWKAANPGQTVWLSVNLRAVPACTGSGNRPIVVRFCCFGEISDGSVQPCESNARGTPDEVAYCDEQFAEYLAERSS